MADTPYFMTGALGCIGAWVVKALVDRGDVPVVFDKADDARRLKLLLDDRALGRVRFMRGDVTDAPTLRAALEVLQYDGEHASGPVHQSLLCESGYVWINIGLSGPPRLPGAPQTGPLRNAWRRPVWAVPDMRGQRRSLDPGKSGVSRGPFFCASLRFSGSGGPPFAPVHLVFDRED